jgi:hypothetical protein
MTGESEITQSGRRWSSLPVQRFNGETRFCPRLITNWLRHGECGGELSRQDAKFVKERLRVAYEYDFTYDSAFAEQLVCVSCFGERESMRDDWFDFPV